LTIFIGFQFSASAEGHSHAPISTFQDTIPKKDTLRYPIKDRHSDKYTYPGKNPFDLKDPANIRDSIVYDPKTKEYHIIEKIGTKYFRKPTSLSFDEYMRIQSRKMEVDYFQKRANTSSLLNRKLSKPKLNMGDDLFNRLFRIHGISGSHGLYFNRMTASNN
jgi:hypothetical protein